MKPRSELFFCLGLLVVSFMGLHALELERPRLPGFSIGNCPDPRDSHKNSSKLTISPVPGTTRIPFNYHDFSGMTHSFDCWIDSDYLINEELRLGLPVGTEAIRSDIDRVFTK
jgi:hypothetical protein